MWFKVQTVASLLLFSYSALGAIVITSPAQGATLNAGEPTSIEWTGTSDTDIVTLLLRQGASIDVLKTLEQIVQNLEAGLTSYDWTPSNDLTAADDYYIELNTLTSGNAVAGPFAITSGNSQESSSSSVSSVSSTSTTTSETSSSSSTTTQTSSTGTTSDTSSTITSTKPTSSFTPKPTTFVKSSTSLTTLSNGSTSAVIALETSTGLTSPSQAPTSSSSNKGAVIGGAVGGAIGGLILLGALIALIFFLRKRKQKKNEPYLAPLPEKKDPVHSPIGPSGSPGYGDASGAIMKSEPIQPRPIPPVGGVYGRPGTGNTAGRVELDAGGPSPEYAHRAELTGSAPVRPSTNF